MESMSAGNSPSERDQKKGRQKGGRGKKYPEDQTLANGREGAIRPVCGNERKCPDRIARGVR